MNSASLERRRTEIEQRYRLAVAHAQAVHYLARADAASERALEQERRDACARELQRLESERATLSARLPSDAGWATGSVALVFGLSGFVGAAVGVALCIARLPGWASDLTASASAWWRSLQATVPVGSRVGLTVLLATVATLGLLGPRWVGRQRGLLLVTLGSVACVGLHWPWAAPGAQLLPLVDGLGLVAAGAGAVLAARAHGLAVPGLNPRLASVPGATIVALAVFALGWTGLALCVLTALAAQCAWRTKRALDGLVTLAALNASRPRLARLRAQHDRDQGVFADERARPERQPPLDDPAPDSTRPLERARAIERELFESMSHAHRARAAQLHDLDCQQILADELRHEC
jgi:hypothetical protein